MTNWTLERSMAEECLSPFTVKIAQFDPLSARPKTPMRTWVVKNVDQVVPAYCAMGIKQITVTRPLTREILFSPDERTTPEIVPFVLSCTRRNRSHVNVENVVVVVFLFAGELIRATIAEIAFGVEGEFPDQSRLSNLAGG